MENMSTIQKLAVSVPLRTPGGRVGLRPCSFRVRKDISFNAATHHDSKVFKHALASYSFGDGADRGLYGRALQDARFSAWPKYIVMHISRSTTHLLQSFESMQQSMLRCRYLAMLQFFAYTQYCS